jgi:DNA-binding response OmpR family regulator
MTHIQYISDQETAITRSVRTTPVVKYRILVIEDDDDMHTQIVDYFTQRQYIVSVVQTSNNALQVSTSTPYDCILLGIPTTLVDTIYFLQQLRQHSNVPIIMLSPHHNQYEKILSLQMGADDYLHKPIDLHELDARITVILRRIHATQLTCTPFLRLNINNRSVLANEQTIEFTPMEFAIISKLLQSPNRVFSRQELTMLIFSEQFSQFSAGRSIDMHISKIRTKIEPNPDKPQYIVTVYAKGYMYQTR